MQHIGDTWLHIRQGSHETSLKHRARVSDDVTFTPPIGRVMHLDSNGEFVTGLTNSAALVQIPFMLDRSPANADVKQDGGDPETDRGAWSAANVIDEMTYGICLLGDYEIETTEFEPEATAGAYAVNQVLTATADDTNATTGGRITKATFGTSPIIGIISGPVGPVESDGLGGSNNVGVDMLRFFTYYFPRLP